VSERIKKRRKKKGCEEGDERKAVEKKARERDGGRKTTRGAERRQ
jgi:hypothetical protein